VHVISRKALREFALRHRDAVLARRPGRKCIVFNIKGNHYRLICRIDYAAQVIYLRHELTRKEYDRGEWN